MDWQQRTQRQVGAEGIEAVRRWLSEAAAEGTHRPTPPGRVLWIAVALATLVGALVLAPGPHSAAAAPLPAGTYHVTLGAGDVRLVVGRDGTTSVTADDGLVAILSFDTAGRVLDRFEVASPAGVHRVEIAVMPDQAHHVESTLVTPARTGPTPPSGSLGELADAPVAEAAATASAHGAVVLLVADCAPRGAWARSNGWPNHGTIVSRAASGLPLAATVADPATGTTARIDAPLETVSDAVAFCALVADLTVESPESAGDMAGSDPDVSGPTDDSPGAGSSGAPSDPAGGQPPHETGPSGEPPSRSDQHSGRPDRGSARDTAPSTERPGATAGRPSRATDGKGATTSAEQRSQPEPDAPATVGR